MLEIKNEGNKAVDEIEMEFLGGPGVHFQGEVNCLTSEPSFGQKRYSIYAECEIPEDEDASEDYGYLTMKRRIEELLPKMLPDVKQLHFKYDGYEDRLENDANAACDVYCEFIDDDYGIFEQEVIMSWE